MSARLTAGVWLCAALVAVLAASMLAGAQSAHSSSSTQPARSSSSAANSLTTIAASFHPDRPGAMGALTINLNLTGGALGDLPPLRRSVLRLPAGLGVEIPHLVSCRPARLRRLGVRGCPVQSRLGVGHARVQAPLGSQLLGENVSLWVFLGPLRNLQPTFEILGQGYTPFDERIVLTGTVLPDDPPYGEDLVLQVPAIPTLPLEPDASIVSVSLTIGSPRRTANQPNSTVEPLRCPLGGFPFAAELTYAGGSQQDATSAVPCPRSTNKKAGLHHAI